MAVNLYLRTLLGAALLLLAVVGCGGGSDKNDEVKDVSDLAKAVVQISAVDSGEVVWSGSGTMISSDGLILTNAHVVDDIYDEGYEIEELRVATTSRTDRAPEPAYMAEIVNIDYALDLAVVQITSDLDGQPVAQDFPSVALGDSDDVEIGDELRILGYPGIGGNTITFTNGVVSGFSAERSLGQRAWIKTDATISGGSSGGLAVDIDGKLVGVPTIVGSSEDSGELVDCRQIADTNRDGTIDDLDTCVSVGGFINGLRPVSLALELIDAAESGIGYISKFEPAPESMGDFDVENVYFSRPAFAGGVTADDEPTEVLDALPSGGNEICAFWDYEGMADGMNWEAIWFVNGEVDEEGSFLDETWDGGQEGTDWWVCFIGQEAGLPDGLYELVLSVEGEYIGSNTVFVGGSHPPVLFEIRNDSSTPICYVYITPSAAQNWGFDWLGSDEGIDIGDTQTFVLPAVTYDLALDDCDQKSVVEEYELDITEGSVFTVTDQ